MKKTFGFLLVFVASITLSIAQAPSDSVTVKKVFGGYQFFQGGNRLNMNQLVNAVKYNNEAYIKIMEAKSDYTLATVIGAAGGFLIGYPLGTSLGGGEPNWALAGVGAGLVIISIPITNNFSKKAKDAIDTYNSGLATASFWDKKELNLAGTANGLGLVLKF